MVSLGFAHLENPALKDLRGLEEKYGIILLAYQKPLEPAELSQDQIVELQHLERKLKCRILAYRG